MFSLLFGSKKNGTGYGGHVVNDTKNLKRGREKAIKAATKESAATLAYLIETGPLLRNKTLENTNKLVSTLVQVFRNQVPTDWAKNKKLLVVSLTCLSLVLQNYRELVGKNNGDKSLAAAFDELAQHAHFLNKHGKGKEHARMVNKILELQSTLMAESDGKNNGIQSRSVVAIQEDPLIHYRKTLSPLRFDFCESLQGHSFSKHPQSTKLNMRTLFQELVAFKSALPVEFGSSIFVRAVEGRLDLLRALIIGPQDTPYANGCFLFDIWLKDYPNKPPKVKFLTTGGGRVTFNPNLYSSGKVCLSLLGTWDGPGWINAESTLLQVLVSIQSLIFVPEPMYNEPLAGMVRSLGMLHQRSVAYNANIRRHVLQHAILPFITGGLYPEFRQVMQQHYCIKKLDIQQQMQQWMKDDSTLSSIVEQVSTKLNRRSKVDKTRKVEDKADDETLRKKQKTV